MRIAQKNGGRERIDRRCAWLRTDVKVAIGIEEDPQMTTKRHEGRGNGRMSEAAPLAARERKERENVCSGGSSSARPVNRRSDCDLIRAS